MPLPVIVPAGLLCLPLVLVFAVLARAVVLDRREVGQGAPRWVPNAPDPAFRDEALVEDEQWAGIEDEWHAFLDGFGVREVPR